MEKRLIENQLHIMTSNIYAEMQLMDSFIADLAMKCQSLLKNGYFSYFNNEGLVITDDIYTITIIRGMKGTPYSENSMFSKASITIQRKTKQTNKFVGRYIVKTREWAKQDILTAKADELLVNDIEDEIVKFIGLNGGNITPFKVKGGTSGDF